MNASTGTSGATSATRLASFDQLHNRDVRPGRFQVAMAPDPTRVAQMRRITGAFMRLWAVPTLLADDVRLVVSELVTNALLYSGSDEITLALALRAGSLRIDVHDGVPKHWLPRHRPRDDDEHGRGLFLVQAIADVWRGAWGVSEDGTTTWCELSLVKTAQPLGLPGAGSAGGRTGAPGSEARATSPSWPRGSPSTK
ncbi:ATP-binding protein [Streptomyces noursei]|uniref:ATP-binding protein n=1 Tax=Streptomyces noursei TaxID=1971 RepID=UPI0019B44588|nr:ATP-binding protein [Streptomyces noursei]MCZ1014086.1 ATP-binding protein [Streptomyces noursei]GGX50764.1 hypothetical protein GCM10010341_85480 [Streptomyces noursei]